MSTPQLDEFRSLLDEIFQFDRADLDFGIYRILNQKRDEVKAFFTQHLEPQVEQALAGMQSVDTATLEKELAEMEKQMRGFNMLPDAIAAVPKVQELKAKLNAADHDTLKPEEVFSALTEFFRRYYDKGDFLSRPLYRKGVYAIPYEGQEVKLHFANSDQYYVKTGEHFTDYAFTLDDGRVVRFALTEASTERDNNKAQNGKDRCFVLSKGEDTILAEGDTLTLRFGYVVPEPVIDPDTGKPKKPKQEDLNREAVAKVLADLNAGEFAAALGALKPTEKQPKRTLLEAKLSDYTARNKFDYFIHKDLGSFLRRELGFYIKSEVVPLDDLTQTDIERLERTLKKAQAIRKVAETLITFLAQLEDFQKHIFLKKKFVVETGWCVTLDRVPSELWETVTKSAAQVEEWKRLYAIHEHTPTTTQSTPWSEPPSVAFLQEHPHLMVDTAFFDRAFTESLLGSWEDIEAQTDGVIVNSENLQALNLLKARYAGEVKCIYIDPPYNTGGDGFLYKDSYQHSSWLSMMQDRLTISRRLLNDEGTIFVSIDNHESGNLINLLNSTFGDENFIADLVWEKTRKNDAKLFSIGHEYMFCYANDMMSLKRKQTIWREMKPGAQEIILKYQELRVRHIKNNIVIQEEIREWYKSLPLKHPSKALSRYKWVDDNGPWRDRDISWPGGGGPRYKVIHPITKQPCKIPDAGWRYATLETMLKQIELKLVEFREDHTQPPYRKAHLIPVPEEIEADIYVDLEEEEEEEEEIDAAGLQVMPSVIYRQSQVSVKFLRQLMGYKAFDNPKDHEVLARIIQYTTAEKSLIFDFFGGSGTTAHAVINLNRQKNSVKRNYILSEMGGHFDTVLKPRLLKAAYCSDWKMGKPQRRDDGVSHTIKYLRLESYEDALNNLELTRPDGVQVTLDGAATNTGLLTDYYTEHMTGIEQRGSKTLVVPEALENPFTYTLKVANGDVGATLEKNVDVIETFHYLLGLRVERRFTVEGVRVSVGTLPRGEKVLVAWRIVVATSDEEIKILWKRENWEERFAPGTIYVNGPCSLQADCPPTASWRVLRTEHEFTRLMNIIEEIK